MSWCKRRYFLLSAAALAGCGFTPLYAPSENGTDAPLSFVLPKATTRAAYLFNTYLREEGVVDNAAAPALNYDIVQTPEIVARSTDGSAARYNLLGKLEITVTDNAHIWQQTINAFVGYSATGSAPANRAAKEAAQARLLKLLASQAALRLRLYQRENST